MGEEGGAGQRCGGAVRGGERPYGVRRAAEDVHDRDGVQERVPRQDVAVLELASTLKLSCRRV